MIQEPKPLILRPITLYGSPLVVGLGASNVYHLGLWPKYRLYVITFHLFASPSYSLKASFVSMTTFLKDWMMMTRTHSEMTSLSSRLRDLILVHVSKERYFPNVS